MKKIVLDFKQQGPRISLAGVVLLAAGVLVAAQLAMQSSDLHARIGLAEQKLTRLEKEGKRHFQGQPVQAADSATLQLEVKQANEILHRLAMPWHGLFQAIESSNEKEIALLSVQPDMQRGVLRLAGEAKSFDALLAYVERLEKNEALTRVFITQHEIRNQDPDKPVRFSLVANWVEKP